MTYSQRKLSPGPRSFAVADLFGEHERAEGLCTDAGCGLPPADGNCRCAKHRDEHRQREKECAARRRFARKYQLVFVLQVKR